MSTMFGSASRLAGAGVFGALLLLPAAPARALQPLPDTAVVAPALLADMRGGLEVAGLRFDLTARLKTYIDDQLALASETRLGQLDETRTTLQTRVDRNVSRAQARATDATRRIAQRTESKGRPDATPTRPDRTHLAANPVTTQVESTARRYAATIESPAPSGDGSSTGRTGGVTTIRHLIGPDRIQTDIMNTANGRSISSALEVELTVHNFTQFSAAAREAMAGRRASNLLQGQ